MSIADLDRVLLLPSAERLELLGRLWDSLTDDGTVPDLTTVQKSALDQRLDRLECDGSQGSGWAEVRRQIERSEPLT